MKSGLQRILKNTTLPTSRSERWINLLFTGLKKQAKRMRKLFTKYKLYFLPFVFLTALLLYVRWLLVFSYNVDIDGLEYYFVHLIQEMQQHKPMYANPMAFPYSVNLYTPVYLYLFNGIIHLTKVNIYNDVYKILVIGRL